MRRSPRRSRRSAAPVCLATVLVGDDPASHIYVSKKHDACAEAGIESRDHRFPAATPESEVLELLEDLNADDGVDGILVQLPLPEHMDESTVTLVRRRGEGRRRLPSAECGPALPRRAACSFPRRRSAIMALLDEYEVELKGKEAVVIGRSEIVGQADRDAAPRPARDRDDLPFANRRISPRTRAERTFSSPPSGRPGLVTQGHGQAGSRRDRRRP